jgi:phosphate/sulfate permease
MCSQKNFISICASLLLSTSIGLLIATSLFSFIFSPLASSASSRSRSWTPFSTLVDNPSEDPWADVDYFYFFLSTPCKMGGKVTKPKTITVTETSGFKEEDHLWSIINIHLSCAINTVLSLCAVIFVICILVYAIQRIVQRYCKKKRAAKERQCGISMLPFHQNQTFGTKFDPCKLYILWRRWWRYRSSSGQLSRVSDP